MPANWLTMTLPQWCLMTAVDDGGASSWLTVLIPAVLTFVGLVITQFVIALRQHREEPRVERDSIMSVAQNAIEIMSDTMESLRMRIGELETDVIRFAAENAQMRAQLDEIKKSGGKLPSASGEEELPEMQSLLKVIIAELRTLLALLMTFDADDVDSQG